MTTKNLETKDTSTTYSFIPTNEGNLIDYTGVEPNKIKLANRKTILTEEYPSYLPQVQIRRKTKYDIPTIKLNDNEFLIKESDELGSKIFKVSLDVYAAVLNYHLEYDKAAASEIQKLNALARTEAKQKEEKRYSYITLNDLPQYPNKISLNSINNPYNTCGTRIHIGTERVSLRSPKSGRMSTEAFGFITDYIKTLSDEDDKKINIRGNIFKMYGECINDVKQKILDIEYQELDNESSYIKGVETSYGDSSLNEELLDSHGIIIKRQNGDIINSKEIKEIQYAIDKVHSIYGDLSDTTKEFGLKISHSGKKRMHASKFVGKFIPSYKAIGISFDNDIKNSSLTAIHEYTHFLDHLQGKEKNAWFASDIQGSIENQIAVKFRNNMNKTKGDYWSRTCECFARAMEEYADIIITKEMHGSITEEHLTFYNNLQGSVPIEKFQTEIEPLVLTLIDDYKKQYAKNPNEQSIEKDQKADIKIHLTNLSKMLESGKSFTVRNDELGDILIDAGETGKGGYGIKHIIEQRYKKDEKKENEITALVPLIIESAIDGKITRDNNYTLETSKDGIVAILRKESDDKSKKWILTGYDDLNKQKEATDAIKTVTANYSYTPEFSRFRKQVGAVIASVTKVSYKDEVLSTSDLKKDDYQKQIYDLAVEKSKKEKQHRELIINQNEIENTVSMLENRLLIITPRLDELRKQVNVQNITDQNFQNTLLDRERKIQKLEALDDDERKRNRQTIEDLRFNYKQIKEQYEPIEEQGKLIRRELALTEDFFKEINNEFFNKKNQFKDIKDQVENLVKELASLDFKGRILTAELVKLEKAEESNIKNQTNENNQKSIDVLEEKRKKEEIDAQQDIFYQDNIKIYKTKIREENDIFKEMWAVQDERNIGTDRKAYDLLFDTRELAIEGARREKKERILKAEQKIEEEKNEKTSIEQEEKRKEKNRGLSITERKANDYLKNNLHRAIFNGKTAEQHMELEGVYLEKVETDHQSSYNRIRYNRMNDQEQQEYEKKLREPKTEYRMYTTTPGRYFEIGATLFNYLSEKHPNKIKQKEESQIDKEVVPTTENIPIPEIDIDNSIPSDSKEHTVLQSPKPEIHLQEDEKEKNKFFQASTSFIQLSLFDSSKEVYVGDPALNREHIREAKIARRVYTDNVIKGQKTGLWKSFKDFKKHGVFDIQGAKVATDDKGNITSAGWEQLYQSLSIYRDKRFETFRILFVSQEGEIRDQLAVSNHMPGLVRLNEITDEMIHQMSEYAIETKTRLVLVHNHPSGNVQPSTEDMYLTEEYTKKFIDVDKDQTLIAGHIILDHNSFSLYDVYSSFGRYAVHNSYGRYDMQDWKKVTTQTEEKDPLMKKRIPKFIETSIIGEEMLIKVANEINETDTWNNKDWVPVLFTNASHAITGINYYSKERIINSETKELDKEFKLLGKKLGAIRTFSVLDAELEKDKNLEQAILKHTKEGSFQDFCINGKTAKDYNITYSNQNLYLDEIEIRPSILETHIDSTIDHVLQPNRNTKKTLVKETKNQEVGSPENEAQKIQELQESLFKTHNTPSLPSALNSISKADIGKPNTFIAISDKTPFIFKELGLPEAPVSMYRDKLARALYLEPRTPYSRQLPHGHSDGLDKKTIEKVFENLANPYYVFKSKDGESLVGVYDVLDKNNEPVIVAFNYNTDRNGVEANWVKSLYGKSEYGIEYWAQDGLLRYVNDKEKATELSITLSVRVMGSSATYKQNILHKSDLVNSDFVQEAEQGYARVMEEGRKMEDNGKKANSLEPLVLNNEIVRQNFYSSIGIDPFYKSLDSYLEQGLTPESDNLFLTHTPEILKFNNLTPDGITISINTIETAKKSGLSNADIRTALQNIAFPAFIFTVEDNSTHKKIYTHQSVQDHNLYAVSVEIDTQNNTNEIVNIHYESLITPTLDSAREKLIGEGLLVYYDDYAEPSWSAKEQSYMPLNFDVSPNLPLHERHPVQKNGENVGTRSDYIRETILNNPKKTFSLADPALTRDDIRIAKKKMRALVKPVLEGEKSGLWKSFRTFKKHGVFDIQGSSISVDESGKVTDTGWKQMYQALSIYRDKRFETFRILFVDTAGQIKNQLALSSHLPHMVNVEPVFSQYKDSIISHAEKTNTRIVFVHNHPSGSTVQSDGDIHTTNSLYRNLVDSNGLPLLSGHIILDHDSFSVWRPESGWSSIQTESQEKDPLLKNNNPTFTQVAILDYERLYQVAQEVNDHYQWNEGDWVPILFTELHGKTMSMRYYAATWLQNSSSEILMAEFQKVGVDTGAVNAFPIVSEKIAQQEQLVSAMVKHLENGVFREMSIGNKTGLEYGLPHAGKKIFDTLTDKDKRDRTQAESTFDIDRDENWTDEAIFAHKFGFTQQSERRQNQADELVSITQTNSTDLPNDLEGLFKIQTSPNLSKSLESISISDIGKPNERVVITEQTPFIFTELGLPKKSIEIYLDKIARCIMLPITERHGHNNSITKENALEVFSQLADPRAVFRSKDSGSLVAVYDVLDAKNEPIMISLKAERRTIEANLITSMYGKPTRDIEYWLEKGQLLYVNDLNEEKAFMLPSRQLRMSNINAFTNINLIHKSDLVNSGFEQEYARGNGERTIKDTGKELSEGSNRIELAGGGSTSRDEMKAEGAIAYITWNEGIYGFDLLKFYDKESFVNALDNALRDEPNRVGFGVLVDNDDLITKAKALEWHHRIDDPEINAQYTDAQLKKYGVIAYKDENIYGKKYRSTFQDKESLLLSYKRDIAKDEGTTYKILIEDTELENTIADVYRKGIIQENNYKESLEPKKTYLQVTAEAFYDSVKNNSAPFLSKPSETGMVFIYPSLIRSGDNGYMFKGINQIIAQTKLKEFQSPETYIITYEQAKKYGAGINKGEKSLILTNYDPEKKATSVTRYYPLSAVYNADKLPPKKTLSSNIKSIRCDESDPVRYLGKYLAATALQARFETTKDVQEDFKLQLEKTLKKALDEKKYEEIHKLGNEANIVCKGTMGNIFSQLRSQKVITQNSVETSKLIDIQPHNPVTGELFMNANKEKALYLMERRNSKDPRFLELSDILSTGLKLKNEVGENLLINKDGKTRFFYNAIDIDGIPPQVILQRNEVSNHRKHEGLAR